MRIVKRGEFLKLPVGTLYSQYEHCYFQDLRIKGETINTPSGDWFYQSIQDSVKCSGSDEQTNILFAADEQGTSFEMDFEIETRDGAFEPPETMYVVWDRGDVEALISRLRATLV